MERKKEALSIVMSVVRDQPTAEMVLERLQDEGLLHLGYGKAEVDQVVGLFKELFGNTKTTQADRSAANRLTNAHTLQTVTTVMRMMKQAEGEQFMPTIGSVKQLEDKWVNVISFLRKKMQQNEEVDI